MEKPQLRYKGYTAKVRFSAEDGVFYGKVEGISSLVLFEAEREEQLEKAFCEAVDGYLAFCREHGKEPEKP